MHLPDIEGVGIDANYMLLLLLYCYHEVTHCLALPNVNWEGSVGFAENPTEEFEIVI